MKAAGGVAMDSYEQRLQYMVREHLAEKGMPEPLRLGHGFIEDSQEMLIRWNSQYGNVFVDGAHVQHALELGDEIVVDNRAPPIQMFDRQLIETATC